MNEKQPQPTSGDASALSFEQALAELEKVVHRLEGDEIGLHEALADYERGVNLLRHLYDLLQKTERKIELLSGVDADGNPICGPLDDTAVPVEEKAERRSRRRTAPQPGDPPEEGVRKDNSDVDVPGGLF